MGANAPIWKPRESTSRARWGWSSATVRRPPGFYAHLMDTERQPERLSPEALRVVSRVEAVSEALDMPEEELFNNPEQQAREDHMPNAKSTKAKNKGKINVAINKRIATFAEGQSVHYMHLDDIFLNDDGILTKEIMPDALHPKQEGYKLWAEAIEPKLKSFGI